MSTKTEGHHQRFGYLQKPDLHHSFAGFWANSNNKMKKIVCVYFIIYFFIGEFYLQIHKEG